MIPIYALDGCDCMASPLGCVGDQPCGRCGGGQSLGFLEEYVDLGRDVESDSLGPVDLDWNVYELLSRPAALGEVVIATTALAVAAAWAISRYGPGVADWFVDGFESVIGVSSCSSDNKKKHRARINALIESGDAGIQAIADGLASGKMTGATGECLKYALAYAAERVTKVARDAGLPLEEAKAAAAGGAGATRDNERLLAARRAEAEAVLARSWPDAAACRVAVKAPFDAAVARGEGSGALYRALLKELAERCRAAGNPPTSDPMPEELRLIGFDPAGWGEGNRVQALALVEMVRKAQLTPDQQAELRALPYAQRRERFMQMVEANSGMPWWVWVLAVGLAIAAVGGVVYLVVRE